MGIRFSCHSCAKPLNIKSELAGRRGVCPECGIRFRIPLADAEFSTALEDRNQTTGTAAHRVANRGAREVVMAGGSGEYDSGAGLAVQDADQAGHDQAADVVQTANGVRADTDVSQPTEQSVAGAAEASDGIEAELLSGDDTATWYVRPPSGGQYGPATVRVLKSWIGEGRVAKNALLWREGWPQWREAADALPELAESLPGGATTGAESAFAEPSVAASVGTNTDPGPFVQPASRQPTLDGNAKIGAVRRKRSAQRITLVAILAALVVGLIVTLILVASSGS